ncbi:MAG: hypothetical protein CR991_10615 [Proteobacteria bacterium]|nr:MAG: hypothetical protein CR991_10615 [Pseudomonadota bacterium]
MGRFEEALASKRVLYVGSKANPQWLWYAWSPHLNTVFAYVLGS